MPYRFASNNALIGLVKPPAMPVVPDSHIIPYEIFKGQIDAV